MQVNNFPPPPLYNWLAYFDYVRPLFLANASMTYTKAWIILDFHGIGNGLTCLIDLAVHNLRPLSVN